VKVSRWLRRPRPANLAVGSRVIVRKDSEFPLGPWPGEPTGQLVSYPDGTPYAEVATRQGVEKSWWVKFDEPQFDADGDGPYQESQVLQRYLETSD
jgi:hypothetical protein